MTASFLKELLRRAALRAAVRPGEGLRVTGADLERSLDELLDVRSTLTRTILGSQPTARATDWLRTEESEETGGYR